MIIGGTYYRIILIKPGKTLGVRVLSYELEDRVVSLIREKTRTRLTLESLLDPKEKARARADHHARRKPRPCGMTIHTGIGCSYGCVYCYIWDMGFPGSPKPYPLSPLGMAYALTVNPYVVPGHTLAAYGSVTEPFLPETRERAIEYIAAVHKWLRLPSQVSTKAVIDGELALTLKSREPGISVLVSAVALGELARRLEPNAPSTEDRLRAAGAASRVGLHVTLFLRPIIPGIPMEEYEALLRYAREQGLERIVLGTLRVTRGIVSRLRAVGVEIPPSRLPETLHARHQVPVRAGDIKEKLGLMAEDLGFTVYPSACAANIDSHSLRCWKCPHGPCRGRPRDPGVEQVAAALRALTGGGAEFRVRKIGPCNYRVYPRSGISRIRIAAHWVGEVSMCRVTVAGR